jgi:hypothetical protein
VSLRKVLSASSVVVSLYGQTTKSNVFSPSAASRLVMTGAVAPALICAIVDVRPGTVGSPPATP